MENLKEQLSEKGVKHKLQFSTKEREFYERECGFTDEELEIFRMRARGYSIIQISFEMSAIHKKDLPTGQYGTGKVEARIRAIKNKILRVL